MSDFAFSKKIHRDGSKVTMRKRGFSLALDNSGSAQSTTFVVPHTRCLMTATEIINAVAGDQFKLEVLDTAAGTVSGIPNYSLNIFGDTVNAAPTFYRAESPYDAELFQGLQIKITCIPADSVSRNLYFNLELHELS